ncbi:MAG TPA: hypothetical protein VN829_11590 [Dongiaceae bacterium]|nr:hypothetical protein [Dongiaceae bacterium]
MSILPSVAIEAGRDRVGAAPSALANILVIDDEAPVRRALGGACSKEAKAP